MSFPIIVALDSEGDVYVTENTGTRLVPHHTRIRKYSADLAYLRSFESGVDGFPVVVTLADIAFDSSDRMYVSDSGSDAVHVVDRWGVPLRTLAVPLPTVLAVDRNDELWVGTFPDTIRHYDRAGVLLGQFRVVSQICRPLPARPTECARAFVTDLIYTPDDELLVVSQLDQAVLAYDTSGTLLDSTPHVLRDPHDADRWCRAENPFALPDATHETVCAGNLDYPFGIALDPWGRLYVTENSRFGSEMDPDWGDVKNPSPNLDPYVVPMRVQMFDAAGELEGAFGSYCTLSRMHLPRPDLCVGSGDAQFDQPHGIAVSADGRRIYVADTSNDRLSVWER